MMSEHLRARTSLCSCNWRSQNVSGSQRKLLVSPSHKVSHLIFTTALTVFKNFLSFYNHLWKFDSYAALGCSWKPPYTPHSCTENTFGKRIAHQRITHHFFNLHKKKTNETTVNILEWFLNESCKTRTKLSQLLTNILDCS